MIFNVKHNITNITLFYSVLETTDNNKFNTTDLYLKVKNKTT